MVAIYIQEAHACDEWRMGQPLDIAQHRNLRERQAACLRAIQDLQLCLPCYIDDVTEPCGRPNHYGRCSAPNFERYYGSWPLKIYVFDSDGTVLHIHQGERNPLFLHELDDAVLSLLKRRSNPSQSHSST